MSIVPVVSIIICTSKRCDDLRHTLLSLAQVSPPLGLETELLVVENGTPSGVESVVSTFHHPNFSTHYLCEPIPGKSRGLNLALARAKGEVLIFTDDDVRFPKDWIRGICEPILEGRAQAVAGSVQLAPHLLRPWMNRTHRAWLASTADYLSPTDPSEMCGANMAIARTVFDRIHGFDTELGPGVTNGGEESLLSWQIKKAGFRIEPAFHVQVEHHLSPDRLQYQNWTKAARHKGHTRAYLLHHWFQETLDQARLRQHYYKFKLRIRRVLTGTRKPTDEGIALWELSYIEEIAKYERFLLECKRPRNYALHGLQKLAPQSDTVTS